MQKAIYYEKTGKQVERVLSISDISILENNPTGLEYILIDDYTEPPKVENPALNVVYPMYDTVKEEFLWVVVNYMYTATEGVLEIQNIRAQVESLKSENQELTKTISILLTGGEEA